MTVIALFGLAPAIAAAAPGTLSLTLTLAPGTPGMIGGLAAMVAPVL